MPPIQPMPPTPPTEPHKKKDKGVDRDKRKQPWTPNDWMTRVDTNKDGVISKADNNPLVSKALKLFDFNHNGQVTLKEISIKMLGEHAIPRRRSPGINPKRDKNPPEMLPKNKPVDKNNDFPNHKFGVDPKKVGTPNPRVS